MKTLKLFLVATILTCSVVNLAYADGIIKEKPKKVCNIVFAKAVQDPNLVLAMKAQLNPGFLELSKPLYLVEVRYNGAIYRILGSRQQWVSFFWHIKLEMTAPANGALISN